MTIVRIKQKRNPFAIVDKTPYLDQRMTWQARGMMIYLMCKPDNWTVQINDLVKQTPDVRGQGKEGVQGILKELGELGYVARIRVQDPETGHFAGWETLVFETPEDRANWESANGRSLPDNGLNPSSGSSHNRVEPNVGSTPPLISNEGSKDQVSIDPEEIKEEDTGTGQAQWPEPVKPVEVETTPLSSEKGQTCTTADRPGSENQSSAAPPPKKVAPKAAAIYALIKDLPRFERFWAWYSKEFCSVTSHTGGAKSEAGAAWLHLEQTDYLGVGVEGFNQGIKIQIKKRPEDGVGIQHACRFLSGGGKGEPDWLVDYQESIAAEHVSPKAFLADLAGTDPHTPDDLESRKARRREEVLAQARAESDRLMQGAA